MNREFHFNLWYVSIALLLLLGLQDVWQSRAEVQSIPYSEFQQALREGRIARVEIGSEAIEGTYKSTSPDGRAQRFRTVPVASDLARELDAAKVEFAGEPGPGLLERAIVWLLPTLLFFLLWLLLMGRVGGGRRGLMSVGRSQAKVYVEETIATRFDDVAGVDEAKEELQEIIEFLRDPKAYGRLGARIPKGILLVGPPGTGKTLLARAVAGEARVPFFSISGSEFVELFVGVGAARVRDLFEQARNRAPCIIFIDELDAVGRARGLSMGSGGHDEKEQTLNQLLNEMDGFDPSVGVVLLAATNRPEILDPALLRSGRFDRQVLVDRPDRSAREAMLIVHLRKLVLATDIDVEEIASLTTGFSGADLANLANEAALLATRRGADAVSHQDMEEALERSLAGLEKKHRVLGERERKIVAFHEIGHALVALSLPDCEPVQKISIIPRGIAALGYTLQRPTEDRYLMTSEELRHRMAVLLGGRAAELLRFDDVSTGAADDLAKATDIAHDMVTRFGMVEELGAVSYAGDDATFLDGAADAWSNRPMAEATAALIDAAVRRLTDDALHTAQRILAEHPAALDRAAARLLERETLGGDELEALLQEDAPTCAAAPAQAGPTTAAVSINCRPGDAAAGLVDADQQEPAPSDAR